MQKQYVTVKLDKRVADVYQAHCAKFGSVLTWRQELHSLLIREAGYATTPLPDTSPVLPATPVPEPVQAAVVPEGKRRTHLTKYQWTRDESSDDKYYDQLKCLFILWQAAQPAGRKSWDYFLLDLNEGIVPYDIAE